ncbi:MAG: hypothetical protein ACFFC7_10540 [Candidatus Hermodarchaeota archaeon]
MQKKRLLGVIFFLSIFLVGVVSVNGAGNVVELGDTINLDFTAKYINGDIFDTTNETIAKENGLYNPLKRYEPAQIEVGQYINHPRGMHFAVLGEYDGTPMTLGERDRNILVPAEDWVVGTLDDVILDILIVAINGVHYQSSGLGLQQLLENPLVALALIIVGGVIVIFLGYRVSLIVSEKYEKVKMGYCEFCGKPAIGRCGNPRCDKSVCRTCFESGCPSCGTNKLAPKRA